MRFFLFFSFGQKNQQQHKKNRLKGSDEFVSLVEKHQLKFNSKQVTLFPFFLFVCFFEFSSFLLCLPLFEQTKQTQTKNQNKKTKHKKQNTNTQNKTKHTQFHSDDSFAGNTSRAQSGLMMSHRKTSTDKVQKLGIYWITYWRSIRTIEIRQKKH